jgi:hypothetical protein
MSFKIIKKKKKKKKEEEEEEEVRVVLSHNSIMAGNV